MAFLTAVRVTLSETVLAAAMEHYRGMTSPEVFDTIEGKSCRPPLENHTSHRSRKLLNTHQWDRYMP
ncbi:MAG: hypothetical protein WAM70_04565 [Pyrinomonadaceae bacterium]